MASSSSIAASAATAVNPAAPFNEETILNLNELIDPPEIDLKTWPTLGDEAKYGLAWEIAEAATENSEADPVAVLVTALAYACTYFGRDTCIEISDEPHHARIFTLIVGATSNARKGTSAACVKKISKRTNELLIERGLPVPKFITGSVSTGEGLTKAVRDESEEKDPTGKPKWQAATDKRLSLIDPEFGQYCSYAKRDGNTASMAIRNAWDGADLEPLTKSESLKASGAHINIIGHITQGELLEKMPRNELTNGAMNRFIIILARRPKLISSPLPTPTEVIDRLARKLVAAIQFSKETSRVTTLDEDAQKLWDDQIYKEFNTDHPDLIVNALIGRSDAYAKRLALAFALLDQSPYIRVSHLLAARAIMNYRRACVIYLYGQPEVGNSVSESIIDALKRAPGQRLMHTELKQAVGCKNSREKFTKAVEQLEATGKVKIDKVKTGKIVRQYIELA